MSFSLSQGPYNYNRFDKYEGLDEAKVAASADDGNGYSRAAKKAGYSSTSNYGKELMKAVGPSKEQNPRRVFSRLQKDDAYRARKQKRAKDVDSLEKAYQKEENTNMDSYVTALSMMAEKQGYNARLDDSLAKKDGKESGKKQSYKDRRDESESMEKKAGKGKFSGNKSSSQKPDFPDVDDDGNKDEPISKATASAKEKLRKCLSKEEAFEIGFELSEEIDAIMEGSHHKVTGVESKAMEEGYKKLDRGKIMDKMQMKPDTAKGERQFRHMHDVEVAHRDKGNRAIIKDRNQGIEKENRLKGQKKRLEKAFNKEEVEINKEDVLYWLMAEEYVTNEVSAEIMFEHMSDDFLLSIEQDITDHVLAEHYTDAE